MTDKTKLEKKFKKIKVRGYKKLTKRKRVQKRVTRSIDARRKAQTRFKLYGFCAVLISLLFLVALLWSIISNGYSAFFQTQIKLEINLQEVSNTANSRKIIRNSLLEIFPEIKSRKDKRLLYQMLSRSSADSLEAYLKSPEQHKNTFHLWIPTSSVVDMYFKGNIDANLPEYKRKIKNKQIEYINYLEKNDLIRKGFNWTFLSSGDSREPESAGVWGSVVGSFFVVISCILLAFPLGVLTAIYLEEFAPKNRLTEIIEVNINNLAAVPSIVFGLLGLAVYLQIFGIPRSASLAGGLTLAMMALPVIVISTRASIRAIPQSIRDGALALGASKLQTTIDHVLPLSMPGIMTGAILSIARILGETAPLLMIGMVAFIVDIPGGFLDPATAMPVQIYLWADSPEQGFAEKTSAAIMVLLLFLVLTNALAVWLRKKFEVRW